MNQVAENEYNLVFVKSNRRLLLGMNKTSLGKGKWNGFGGKVEDDETILQSAKRELKEESNLDVTESDLQYLGIVFVHEENITRKIYIFTTTTVAGKVEETEEMCPKWFDFDQLPYAEMWPDCIEWLSLVLEDSYFMAKFWYKNEDLIKKLVDRLVEPPRLSK